MDIYLAEPRGFCAGVRRALEIVNETLDKYGAPIYVRHEIVHNRHIITSLKQRGVIFIDTLDEISDRSRPVIISAHGASEAVKQQAKAFNLITIDATCPLVKAVHTRIKNLEQTECEIIVIGKPTHPEILGTIGQLKNPGKAHIISTPDEVQTLTLPHEAKIGIVTQTTLSLNDTKEIIYQLQQKFPQLANSQQPNICFATTNRQKAIQKLASLAKDIIIIGSKNSSNSFHLKEAALHYGAERAWLIDDVSELDATLLDSCQNLGISAGASAPEYLITDLLTFLKERYNNINIHNVTVVQENTSFK